MSLQLYLGTVAIDAAMTAGSHVVTTACAGAVIGLYCDVLGAGPDGSTLVASITGVGSGTITLGYAASVDVTWATVIVWKPYAVGRYSLSGEVSSLTNQPSLAFSADRVRNTSIPQAGQPVLVLDLALVPGLPSANTDGDVFGGYVNDPTQTQIAGNANATIDCNCASWEALAAARGTGQPNDVPGPPVDGKFNGMAAGAVFARIAQIMGSDIGQTSVVTGPTIDTITFDYTDCGSAFDSICQASSDGVDTYIWRMDARRNLYFELQTTVAAPWSVSDADTLVGCTYMQSLDKYANVATVTPLSSTGDVIDNTLVRSYNNSPAIDAMAAISGGTGYREVIVQQTANSSLDGATLAESIAKNFGAIPDTVQYSTFRGGLRAGHLQPITISDLGVNGDFLIDSVTLSMSAGKPCWQIHAVDGALIGDWRTALANLANGTGFSSISGGGGGSSEFYTDAIVAGHISPDLANGFKQQVFLVSATAIVVDNPIFTGGTIAANQDFTLAVWQDAAGGRPDPTFDTEYTIPSGTDISTDPLTISTYYFRYDGTSWALIGFVPGVSGVGGGGTSVGTVTALTGCDASTLASIDAGYSPRWQDAQNGVHAVIDAYVSASAYPQTVTLWIDKQLGDGPQWQGWWNIASAAQLVQIGLPDTGSTVYPPGDTDGSWVLIAGAGRIDGNVPPSITAFTSAPFTVPSIPAPAATAATGAYIDKINYGNNGQDGTFWFNLYTTFPYDDPYFHMGRWTVQNGSLVGGVFTPGTAADGAQHDGLETTFADDVGEQTFRQPGTNLVVYQLLPAVAWKVPSYKLPSGAINPNSCFCFRSYVGSRRPDGGSDTTLVQQNDWSSGVGNSTPGTAAQQYAVLNLTTAQLQGMQMADASLPADALDPNTLGDALNQVNHTLEVTVGPALTTIGNVLNLVVGGALTKINNQLEVVVGPALTTLNGILSLKLGSIVGVLGDILTVLDGSIGPQQISTVNAVQINNLNQSFTTFLGNSTVNATQINGLTQAIDTLIGSTNINATQVNNLTQTITTLIGSTSINVGQVTNLTSTINTLIGNYSLTAANITNFTQTVQTIIGSSTFNVGQITNFTQNVQTVLGNWTFNIGQINNFTQNVQTVIGNTTIQVGNVNGIFTLNISGFVGTLDVSRISNLNTLNISNFSGTLDMSRITNLAYLNIGAFNGTLVIGQIGDGLITSAKISSLQLAKLTGWAGALVDVGGAGMSFTSSGYSTVIYGNSINTGSLYCNAGDVSISIAGAFVHLGNRGYTGTLPSGARPVVNGGIITGYV
jgi:flagellar motor switch/type III secretory pathway protein FliN